ncbi:hypothetical protein A0256_11640 [Mucilaginibacter sp. PAMC 26640]|nr:hypothetical protein A0256_11640 [Mucilaginibacter sp. PAMC 26640]
MKRFVVNLLVFTLVLILLVFAMNRNYYPAKAVGNDGYIGAIVDKHAYANKMESPRIIFCGGSNVAFGVDSKAIEQATGLPVVNMGLNASLGLDFMINEIRDIVRPGDIVIISPEYYLEVAGSYGFKKQAQRIYPPAGKYFKRTADQLLHDFFIDDLQHNFYITFSNLTGHAIRKFPTNVVYSRGSFNENGDVVRNFDPHPSHEFLKKVILSYQENQDIPVLNDFKTFADQKGVKVYFLYPAFDELIYHSRADVIKAFDRDLQRDLKIPILNTPENSVFADSLFYDTEYHLTPKGRELRGKRIIEILQKAKIGVNR